MALVARRDFQVCRRLPVLLALCLCIARPAIAGPTEEARAAYQEGVTRFLAADYEGALERFRRAYALDPNPVLLYNVAQVERKLGRWRDAADSYRRYLADDKTLSAERRARVEGFLRECEERAVAPTAPAPPEPASPVVLPAPAPPEPVSPVAPTPPPPATAAPASIVESGVAPAPAKPSLLRRPWFWGAVVGGVVVAGVGAGLAIGLTPRDAAIPDTAGGDMHAMFP